MLESDSLVGDTKLLAAFSITVHAERGGGNHLLVDNYSLEIFSRHNHWHKQLRRRVVESVVSAFWRFVPQKLDSNTRSFLMQRFPTAC